jgi:hypothetical protein
MYMRIFFNDDWCKQANAFNVGNAINVSIYCVKLMC